MDLSSLTRTAKSATTKRSLTLLGVLALLLAVAAYAVAAPRRPAVAAPSIVSGPSGTSGGTVRFGFTGTRGVSFECSLDGASFRACTSPKTYTGLGSGTHEFAVRARNGAGQTSSAAERRWRVDVSAPAVTFWNPQDDGAYNDEGWDEGCPGGRRICGAVSDPSGVEDLRVSIRQDFTGRFWTGSGWAGGGERFLQAHGDDRAWSLYLRLPPEDGWYTVRVWTVDKRGNATPRGAEPAVSFRVDRWAPGAPWFMQAPGRNTSSDEATFRFGGPPDVERFLCRLDGGRLFGCDAYETFRHLRDGEHTLEVAARDRAGNVGPRSTHTWRVDTQPPPKPRLTQKPASPSDSASATFAFTDAERGVSFECRLDGGAWAPCASPKTYAGLADGSHRFAVRAVDGVGNRSGAAEHEWTVRTASTAGEDFTVSGGFPGLLSPGVSGPLAVTVSNPNGEAIQVTSLTVTIEPGSSKPGCDGPANLQVRPSNVSVANPLTVPAHGSVTLPDGGVSAPVVEMLNLSTNQDACQGATFSFSYGGSAHS